MPAQRTSYTLQAWHPQEQSSSPQFPSIPTTKITNMNMVGHSYSQMVFCTSGGLLWSSILTIEIRFGLPCSRLTTGLVLFTSGPPRNGFISSCAPRNMLPSQNFGVPQKPIKENNSKSSREHLENTLQIALPTTKFR